MPPNSPLLDPRVEEHSERIRDLEKSTNAANEKLARVEAYQKSTYQRVVDMSEDIGNKLDKLVDSHGSVKELLASQNYRIKSLEGDTVEEVKAKSKWADWARYIVGTIAIALASAIITQVTGAGEEAQKMLTEPSDPAAQVAP